MSVLNEIAACTKERIAEEKFKVPLRELIAQQNSDLAKHAQKKISFLEALKKPGMSYICEVKKASPSTQSMLPCAACSPSAETVPNWLFMVAALNACAGT